MIKEIWLRQLSHWAMTSAVRVFLLTIAALLGSLLLNGMVWEGRPVMDAATARPFTLPGPAPLNFHFKRPGKKGAVPIASIHWLIVSRNSSFI